MKKNLLSILFALISTLGFSQLSKNKFFEIKLHVNTVIMGEGTLKLGSDVIINTKDKTISFVEYLPEIDQDLEWFVNYIGESSESMVSTYNFKMNSPYSSIGKLSFNALSGKMQLITPNLAGVTNPSALYNTKMTSKYIE